MRAVFVSVRSSMVRFFRRQRTSSRRSTPTWTCIAAWVEGLEYKILYRVARLASASFRDSRGLKNRLHVDTFNNHHPDRQKGCRVGEGMGGWAGFEFASGMD
jgi:hypothetical protein